MLPTKSKLKGIHGVVEDLVKEDEGKEGQRVLQGWHTWKEEEKLGGGAHQDQSGWSRITGAKDL
ncbi:hypothetical protein BY996DRAFT_6619758 [Phakopsora pachyrhizi]|uniref:Uncharacterized protein n=1 Tax=Phakopsora pachyrhizi TaxID=170000 RepID=A0AAV0BED8_PHAPC|nr:hypothetical protein BY996DRAFT_6619758 [Phakopsora pachyrhizi]CAH7685300.1 hypothetical protein PPACK8108_LOCUS19797 [Phakopsora pachyrhizi]